MNKSSALVIAACAALYWQGARAQTVPTASAAQVNPGLINNQNQQNREQLEQRNNLPQGPAVLEPPRGQSNVVAPGGPTFILRGVEIEKSQFLSRQELDAITARYVGTRVDISGVQRMVKEINDLYARKGS